MGPFGPSLSTTAISTSYSDVAFWGDMRLHKKENTSPIFWGEAFRNCIKLLPESSLHLQSLLKTTYLYVDITRAIMGSFSSWREIQGATYQCGQGSKCFSMNHTGPTYMTCLSRSYACKVFGTRVMLN